MLEAEIWGVAETGDGYVIFIKPKKSQLSVPIFVGQLEAQAILIGFGGISISRPLTVDLLLNVIKKLGCELIRIEIGDLRNNTFFGSLVIKKVSGEQPSGHTVGPPVGPPVGLDERSDGEFSIDSRPSDALALAVRCKSPIFIDEKVVEKAGIDADDLMIEKTNSANPQGTNDEQDIIFKDGTSLAEAAKKSLLEKELVKAVETENYERAAEIRDILKSMENELLSKPGKF